MHSEIITLNDPPLAKGRTRLVFPHPENNNCLVKVIRPEFFEMNYNTALPFYKRLKLLRRYSHYSIFLRELKECLAVHARFPEEQSPLAPIFGIVPSNLGLGLVVSKVVDENGNLAATVRSLVGSQGLTPELMMQLETFSAQLHTCDVIVHDLNPSNVLQSTINGKKQLLLIDGFGERNVIPICSMSRYYNRINTRKHFNKMMSVLRRISAARPAA